MEVGGAVVVIRAVEVVLDDPWMTVTVLRATEAVVVKRGAVDVVNPVRGGLGAVVMPVGYRQEGVRVEVVVVEEVTVASTMTSTMSSASTTVVGGPWVVMVWVLATVHGLVTTGVGRVMVLVCQRVEMMVIAASVLVARAVTVGVTYGSSANESLRGEENIPEWL
jgi:hypothetical protein